MASSGFCNNEENKIAENLNVEYVQETNEQFQSCKNSMENGLLLVFKELRKMKQTFEVLSADVSEMKKTESKIIGELEEIKAEITHLKADVGIKTEVNKEILELKSEIKKDFEIKCGESRIAVLSTVFKKVNILEEKMREMGVAQEVKMAEVNGRFTGVTETISTVVHSMLEAKVKEVTSSVDNHKPVQWETEALWEQLRKSEGENKTTRIQLEDEIERLKTRTESFSDHIKTNGQDFQLLKKQLEDERAKNKLVQKKSFYVEPSAFDQLAIPVQTYNIPHIGCSLDEVSFET